MLTDVLIESRKKKLEGHKIALLPIVIGIHVIVVVALVVSSLWSVAYITEPPIKVSLFSTPPPPPPAAKPKKVEQPEIPKPTATSNVAPMDIPDYRPEISSGGSGDVTGAVEGGFEWGDEGGVDGGVVGGIPDGVPVPKPPEDEPVRIGITAEGIQPKKIREVQPDYPEIARRARIEGVVILEAVINKDGTVGEIRVLRSLNPLLDQAAIRAAKQWLFEPGKINGKPVKAYFTLTINFKLL
jgi:periplasmic protein TonB